MTVDEGVGEKICEKVGRNLLSDNSPQSQALAIFLEEAFEFSFNRPPESASDYGYIWSLFIGHSKNDPGDPTAIEFSELNEAWLSQHIPLGS